MGSELVTVQQADDPATRPGPGMWKQKIAVAAGYGLLGSVVVFVLAVAGLLTGFLVDSESSLTFLDGEWVRVTAFASFLLMLLSGVVHNVLKGHVVAEETLQALRQERRVIEERAVDERDLLSRVDVSLVRMQEYQTLNLSQARNSFWFSMGAVVTGLATLVTGIVLAYEEGQDGHLGLVTAASGVLLQFIGGTSFFLYRNSLAQLDKSYAQLVRMQDTMVAIRLVERIPAEGHRSAVMERIVLSLIARGGPLPPTETRSEETVVTATPP